MAFSAAGGLRLNRPDAEIVEFHDFFFVHRGETLYGVIGQAIDVLFLKFGNVAHERFQVLPAGKQGADGRVDGLVRDGDAHDFVAGGHEAQRMVDKEITAHELIDEEFLDEQGS